eukprot:CAMPEP_0177368014 /NCGR_PEP_ID=MMETSP0368-20130122/40684_1 /TAXON_ID=447022 ORGANISM="Scrippsiella hangoei-like, Strain SHHI-4" /NCGR_SAMPLE_ID=MMETSP0368 /ASSEMBLY_ACC=CAM_ASM_000363 /LENGTH=57 /DNA_ID=CAMNT_0018831087 /DNA_START=653 /DNA_END=826 /DNA_ORIENTATION=-
MSSKSPAYDGASAVEADHDGSGSKELCPQVGDSGRSPCEDPDAVVGVLPPEDVSQQG